MFRPQISHVQKIHIWWSSDTLLYCTIEANQQKGKKTLYGHNQIYFVLFYCVFSKISFPFFCYFVFLLLQFLFLPQSCQLQDSAQGSLNIRTIFPHFDENLPFLETFFCVEFFLQNLLDCKMQMLAALEYPHFFID